MTLSTREGIKSVACSLPANTLEYFASATFYPKVRIPGATESDVRVRIRRRIVQIQIEEPGVRAIVPIPATQDHTTQQLDFTPS